MMTRFPPTAFQWKWKNNRPHCSAPGGMARMQRLLGNSRSGKLRSMELDGSLPCFSHSDPIHGRRSGLSDLSAHCSADSRADKMPVKGFPAK